MGHADTWHTCKQKYPQEALEDSPMECLSAKTPSKAQLIHVPSLTVTSLASQLAYSAACLLLGTPRRMRP
jgi:hypothetical protein